MDQLFEQCYNENTKPDSLTHLINQQTSVLKTLIHECKSQKETTKIQKKLHIIEKIWQASQHSSKQARRQLQKISNECEKSQFEDFQFYEFDDISQISVKESNEAIQDQIAHQKEINQVQYQQYQKAQEKKLLRERNKEKNLKKTKLLNDKKAKLEELQQKLKLKEDKLDEQEERLTKKEIQQQDANYAMDEQKRQIEKEDEKLQWKKKHLESLQTKLSKMEFMDALKQVLMGIYKEQQNIKEDEKLLSILRQEIEEQKIQK